MLRLFHVHPYLFILIHFDVVTTPACSPFSDSHQKVAQQSNPHGDIGGIAALVIFFCFLCTVLFPLLFLILRIVHHFI